MVTVSPCLKIKSAGNDPEAIYAVAVEFGVTDSFDIFKAEITDAFGTSEELSEEALKNVTGGALTIQIYEEAIRKAFG